MVREKLLLFSYYWIAISFREMIALTWCFGYIFIQPILTHAYYRIVTPLKKFGFLAIKATYHLFWFFLSHLYSSLM